MGVELFDGFPVKPYQKRRTQTGDRAELRVAVGTALTGRPPHGSQRARLAHWALALDPGVKSLVGPGVLDSRLRKPARGNAVHTFPVSPFTLSTP